MQGIFEGMKAYRRQDRAGYTLFRPEDNARRMQHGAERMCMPAPSVDQFVHAVKQTVLANKRWVRIQLAKHTVWSNQRRREVALTD
jgi:branched-chain amino acid aminotransferase